MNRHLEGKTTRFAFGRNWRSFLRRLSEEQIRAAEGSLIRMLGEDRLRERTFLDVGSGSGLFSLAARRLGARVRSFDADEECVACTNELKRRLRPGDDGWRVERGSALDEAYMTGLGTYDVVYAWGVLHHTGDLWGAADLVAGRVAPGGTLYVAIYNDQGPPTRFWKAIKRSYHRLPVLRLPLVLGVGTYFEIRRATGRILRRENPWPPLGWAQKRRERGMSVWFDLVDWVGGYPFEVARPEEAFDFFRDRGFDLRGLKTCAGRLGCNEFAFRLPEGDGRST